MWRRRRMSVRCLLLIVSVLTVERCRISAATEEVASDLTVAQCVLTLGSFDANADQRINRTEFAEVVEERCSLSNAEEAIWETVFLEAACLCRSFDSNVFSASSSEDCCSVNPVIRRPGQYAKEYTIAVCSFLYDQFAQYNCSNNSNDSNATETPTAAPFARIVSSTELPVIQAPTNAPSLSTGDAAIIDNTAMGNDQNDDTSLAPGMLALLVLLATTSMVLVIWTVQRSSFFSLSPFSSSSDRSHATTVAKGSVQIHKSTGNDNDDDEDQANKKKKKVVVVVVNDPTSCSTSSNDENEDEERALPRKDFTSSRSSASKTTTPQKNYYVDTDHDLMYASHQYFSAPTTSSPVERDRSNPLPEQEDEEDNVVLEDGSASSSSSSSDSYRHHASQSSSSSSSTSSQGESSSVAALLSEPLPMSVLYNEASWAMETSRRPSTIQTTIFEDPGTDPMESSLPDPAWNPGVTMGRSLASGAATLHISPSLPDYGIVQFTEFPSAPDTVVDVDDQTVVVSNRPPSSSRIEDGWPTENVPSVPVDISQPIRKGRTVSKQRTRPLPARV